MAAVTPLTCNTSLFAASAPVFWFFYLAPQLYLLPWPALLFPVWNFIPTYCACFRLTSIEVWERFQFLKQGELSEPSRQVAFLFWLLFHLFFWNEALKMNHPCDWKWVYYEILPFWAERISLTQKAGLALTDGELVSWVKASWGNISHGGNHGGVTLPCPYVGLRNPLLCCC